MRILHVGWGFSPWRPGGLILYAEDLMSRLAANGHQVSYFFSGRHYPHVSGPRLKRWRKGEVAMYEVINPPIIVALEAGTRNPENELTEPGIEAAFDRLLTEVRPDVIHIQELVGLPSSLIELADAANVPTLMTLQDYFPLCTTLRLFDADGHVCMRQEVGDDCVASNAHAPADSRHLIGDTIKYELRRAREFFHVSPRADFSFLAPLVSRSINLLAKGRPARASGPLAPESAGAAPSLGTAFQRRRDLNVKRLNRIGRLIAQSPRVAEIYRSLGVLGSRMDTLPFTLSHIERLRPRRLEGPPSPITFGTLNGCVSPSKGSHVMREAVRRLVGYGREGSFRLLVFGEVDPSVREELESFRGVELRGSYDRNSLDSVLDEMDVGIMPSMWEEAFGYTGLEMIAKGIPLIAHPMGGIVEYAVAGETAWLNESRSGEGLAALMDALIADPDQVWMMHRRVVAARERLVRPMAEHVRAIEANYRELVETARRPGPATA